MANGTAYEEDHAPSLTRRRNDRRVEDVAVDESPVPQTSRYTTTLDISSPDEDKCNSFNYSFADNAIRLIVPNKDTTVSKLMNGAEEDAYTLSSEEAFQYTKLYLNKDKKPELVLVVTKRADTSKETYLELQNGKWTVCDNHEKKMKTLKVITEWKSDFELDLASTSSTNECSIFQVDLLGITTRHFYPKAGYLAVKVNDGTRSIWEPTKPGSRYGSEEDFDGYDYCLSCLIHNKGDKELLEMIVVERLSRRWKYFEKSGEEWMEINKTDFDQKLRDLKMEQSTTPESKY
ncbi:hypothetical protein BEWA_026050 [Theileria equi strain WA]|uniref:Uncharacterized protein n=1 Tax=Theileria equi strain WA TaxID=1537102 RepID=L0AXK8_THEEQ|nr:hypothetical protein BEWA_026050 [Theileria equi strain WA]AFZ79756.1 hypothetical protein BEWA_026050 [Theileria equi strain WA]|eukprot:XP_004829422.1 hypothetical protein BEWA_026050 [Theileria equi strain WA]